MLKSEEEGQEYPALALDARNNPDSGRLLRLLAIADKALAQVNKTTRDKHGKATSSESFECSDA